MEEEEKDGVSEEMLNIKTGDSDPEKMGWRSRGKTQSITEAGAERERDESEKDRKRLQQV